MWIPVRPAVDIEQMNLEPPWRRASKKEHNLCVCAQLQVTVCHFATKTVLFSLLSSTVSMNQAGADRKISLKHLLLTIFFLASILSKEDAVG